MIIFTLHTVFLEKFEEIGNKRSDGINNEVVNKKILSYLGTYLCYVRFNCNFDKPVTRFV